MALDHGLFSFVDVRFNTWPVILIINPKHSMYHQPMRESSSLTLNSSHVRVLVWSPTQLKTVSARIDASNHWLQMRHVKGPLYVLEWNPKEYVLGLHSLEVMAIDADGRERKVEQPFSLDGSHPSFDFWPRVLLMSNISSVFQFLFGCSVCLVIVVLCIFKYFHYVVARNKQKNICRGGIFRWRFVRAIVRKVWLFTAVDLVFWPVVIYMLYLPIGPWLVGELLDNQYGVIFSWGTFVYSSFLPGSLTFAYGFSLVVTFLLPLILGLAHCIDCRMQSLFVEPRSGLLYHSFKNAPLLLTLSLQVFLTYFMYLAYGWLTLLLGPIRSWGVVLGLVLWLQVERLPPSKLVTVADIWIDDQNRYVVTVASGGVSSRDPVSDILLARKVKGDNEDHFSREFTNDSIENFQKCQSVMSEICEDTLKLDDSNEKFSDCSFLDKPSTSSSDSRGQMNNYCLDKMLAHRSEEFLISKGTSSCTRL